MKPKNTEPETTKDSERKIALDAQTPTPTPDNISKYDPVKESTRNYAFERIEYLERENRHMLETIMKNEAAINVYKEMTDLLSN